MQGPRGPGLVGVALEEAPGWGLFPGAVVEQGDMSLLLALLLLPKPSSPSVPSRASSSPAEVGWGPRPPGPPRPRGAS